ncbi:MAG: T9SS type A sorting domain-containing protein [Candidatus Kapaibacterium sp.]
MRFLLSIIIILLSIHNLMSLEPELFSNSEFIMNEKTNNFFEFKGEIYVVGDDGTHGVELMKIDKLADNLSLVLDINEDGDSNPFIITALGDKFIFKTRNDNQSPTKFWSTDGTKSGTTLLFEVERTYSNESLVSNMVIKDNELCLYLPSAGYGSDLWLTDGTAEGSAKVIDENEEILIYSMDVINDNVIILGDNGSFENPFELWSLNDKNESLKLGPYKMKRGNFSSNNTWFIKTENLLFFLTYNEENEESTDLWATDGTKNGIEKVMTFDSGHEIDFYLSDTRNLNNKLIFKTLDSDGWENGLWISDGTESGTFDVKEIGIDVDNIGTIEFEGLVNDRLLISIIDNINFNTTLWSTDGFANGTYKLSDINAGRISSLNPNEVNGYIYYAHGLPSNYQIWKTDGLPGNATEIIDIPKTQHSDSFWPIMYGYNYGNKIHLASIFEGNSDLYSLDVETEELELLHSSQEGGVSRMKFIDEVTYMLYSTKEKSTLLYSIAGKTEEIIPENISNTKPSYYDLELQKTGDYIYFYVDYEGDETFELYRIKNPASGISSVEVKETNEFSFYPNPANNNLTLELEEMTDISIVDINGNQVLNLSNFKGGLIDVSSLTSGFYSITNNTGKLIGKFIKAD